MDKVREAERATRRIQELRHEVIAKLSGDDFRQNAAGVLLSPRDALAMVKAAQRFLAESVNVLEATSWPTTSDYDEPQHDNG
jgi:hypothetical protein